MLQKILKFHIRICSLLIRNQEKKELFLKRNYQRINDGVTGILLKLFIIFLSLCIFDKKRKISFKHKYFSKINYIHNNHDSKDNIKEEHTEKIYSNIAIFEDEQNFKTDQIINFCKKYKTNYIYSTGYEQFIVYREIVNNELKNNVKNNLEGFILGKGQIDYGIYCELPVFNIKDINLEDRNIGILIPFDTKYTEEELRFLEEAVSDKAQILHLGPINIQSIDQTILKNALNESITQNKPLIIIGVNEMAKQLHDYFTKSHAQVAYFVSEFNFTHTFYGLPWRSIYDLIFEDMDNYVVLIADTSGYKELIQGGWNNISNILRSIIYPDADNNKFLSWLSKICLYNYSWHHFINYDVNLGSNVYYGEKQGIKILGDWNNSSSIKILNIGGSTSDPFFYDKSDIYEYWSHILYNRLYEYNISVGSAGIAAHNSNNEFIKFYRDIIPLKPDIVISFSGVNDIYHARMVEYNIGNNHFKRPFLAIHQSSIFSNIVHKAVKYEKNSHICYGIPNDLNVVEHWKNNMLIMHEIGKLYGIKFIAILQPSNVTYANVDMESRYSSAGSDFIHGRKQRYAEARKIIKDIDFILDFTAIFDDLDEDPYLDGAHVLPHGNRTIAEHVHQLLLRSGWLDKASFSTKES